MPHRNNSRTALILSAFSAICLLGAGCKQSVDEVPPLNGESSSPDAGARAQAESDAKAAADVHAAANLKAKADAEAAVAEAKSAAEADARAAEAAKARADASAKVAEDDPYKDAAPDSVVPSAKTVGVAATPAPVRNGADAATGTDAATGAASELASRLISTGLSEHFGVNHGRLVVQVNRATNHTDLTVNRAEVLRVMQDAVSGKGGEGVVSSHSIQGDWQVDKPKAIHLAFDTESRALGLLPGQKLSDAPAVIVNTVVKKAGSGFELAVSAVDTRSGKVFWTDSNPL